MNENPVAGVAAGDVSRFYEVQKQSILHWNYAGLPILPHYLFQHGEHIAALHLKQNYITNIVGHTHQKQ